MITVILIGFGALLAIAVAVGLFDSAGGAQRRWTAAERRQAWEDRQQVPSGNRTRTNGWSDEDD